MTNGANSSPTRRAWRRFARRTLVTALVLASGAVALIHTSPVQQFILRQAEVFARNAGYPFTAKRVQIKPFDLEFSLSGFQYDNRGVRVEVDELALDIPWNIYSADGIVVNALSADGLRVTITSPEPILPEPSGDTTRIPRIVVNRLAVRNGRFAYSNASTRVEVPSFEIETVNGKGTLKLRDSITIAPDTVVTVPEADLQLSPESLLFGPIQWSAVYGQRKGSGAAGGALKWSPSVGININFETEPLSIDKWDRVVARGIVRYEDGVLNIDDFRAARGNGELSASARITDQAKSAKIVWSNLRIDPSGYRGQTSGQLDLQWKTSDLSDISGKGRLTLVTPDYGKATSTVDLLNGSARLGIRADAFGADIRAMVSTGWHRRLAGTFQLLHGKYGQVSAHGRLRGTLASPVVDAEVNAERVTYRGIGPVNGMARVTYQRNILDVTEIMAQLNRSVIPDGRLRIDLKEKVIDGAIPSITAHLGDFVADGLGEIQASALISGSLDKPVGTLTAASGGLDIGGTHIDRVEADARLENDILQVTRLHATQKEGSLDTSGSVNLATERIEGRARISNLQLTDVREFTATVNLDADVSGSLREPSATLKGELENVAYSGQEHGSISVNGVVNRHAVELRLQSPKYSATVDGTLSVMEPYAFAATIDARKSPIQHLEYSFVAGGRVQAEGSLQPLNVNFLELDDFTLAGEGVDLRANGALQSGINVRLFADLAQLPVENAKLTGKAEVSAVVRGTIDSPEIDGELRTTDATVQAAGMPEAAMVEAAVDFTRDRFTIREMQAHYADARVVIGGEGTLKGTGEFTFEAANIRPERFLSDRPIVGLIGVEGLIKLHAPRMDAIEGYATLTQFELNARGVEVRQTQQGEVQVENQIATVRNFMLEGPETKASVAGTVNLASGDIRVDAEADTNLRILEGFIPRSSAFGRIESRVAVRGTTSQPDMKGFVNLDDVQIQIDEPSLLLSEVSARLDLAGSRVQVTKARGNLNGGPFEVTGASGISSGGLQNAEVEVKLSDSTLEYPEGLQTGVAAELMLTGSSPNLLLSGQVNILDAIYREDINLREQVFEQLTPDSDEEPPSMLMLGSLGDINLDVTVETTGPVTIANNVARMDLYGTFRVRGTVSEPVVLGRADALEGGEVYFGPSSGGEATALRERRDRYIIERGTVEFNNPLRTEPTIDFEATHDLQVRDERYAIRLTATGTPTDLRTELTSDPFLSEPDIVAMLLTGRTFSDLQGAQVAVAREQLLDYVSGQLTSRVFQEAGDVLGLDTVTIEPAMGAAEDDLSARLTVGKEISSDLSLIYAQNLAGPRNQSWILNYATVKDLVVRGINRPDQDEIRMELRHGFEIGGGPPLPRRITPRSEPELDSVTFSQTSFTMEELGKQVAKPGSPYSTNRMNDDVRSLSEFLATNGFADAKVRTTREVDSSRVKVHFTIEEGPRIGFEYRGFEVPESVQKEVRQIFVDTRAEAPAVKQSVELLLRHFRDKGYLDSRVSGGNESKNPDERLYVFQIETGTRYRDPEWVFEGVEPLNVTDSAGRILEDPEGIRTQLQAQLRGKGFLDAESTVPALVKEPEPRFVVAVNPGVQYMVSAINYTGNAYFTTSHLTRVVILGPTAIIPPEETSPTRPPEREEQLKPFPYTSDWVSIARRRIMTEYWQQGFNDVQIAASTHYVPKSGKIEVSFDIKEGERQEFAGIRITGDEKTLRSHVQRYLRISEKDPVDYSRISLTRKRLYDTGLFKRVDIQVVKEPEGNIAEINLNERAPWSIKYGFTVTDHRENLVRDRDLGVSTEITYRNLFGRGVVAGFSGKVDRSFREARLFGSFPVFFDRDVTSTLSLFRTREAVADAVSNIWGFTLKQQWRLSDYYLLSYDYGYRRVGTAEIDLLDDNPAIVDGVLPVARFNVTLSRDTRDDIFNATRGSFLSNSFDFAPPGIGSAVRYIKNYTQYLRFREIRPNLIWASAYRLGIAAGLGGTNLVAVDQFNLGGTNSLRAFTQDAATLQPGNALFIMNQELRYPLFWRFGAVGFFDIGNVYDRVGSANPFRQRYSPGLGLRVDTGFVLLRLDMGLNLWPRTGEDRRRISFGIGQAF